MVKSQDINLGYKTEDSNLETLLKTGKVHWEAKRAIIDKYGGNPLIFHTDWHASSKGAFMEYISYWKVHFSHNDYKDKIPDVLNNYFKIVGLPNFACEFSNLEIIDSILKQYNKALKRNWMGRIRKPGIMVGPTKVIDMSKKS